MRGIERALGLLSGLLGLAALAFTLTHQVMRRSTAVVVYGSRIDQSSTNSLILAAGLAVVAALLVTLGAWLDTRRQAARQARGGWRWLVAIWAAFSVAGAYLLILSNLWVGFGGSGPAFYRYPSYSMQVNIALLFFPSTLAALLCAVVAALPRGQWQAPALA